MPVLLALLPRKELGLMHQVRTSLADRLAALIDGVDSNEQTLPTEPFEGMLNVDRDSSVNVMMFAIPVVVDELAGVHADAYAAGWTMPLLQAVATRLLEQSNPNTVQHPGVTPKRLRALLPNHLKAQYMRVLRWFDAAHVLAPSVTPMEPLRHPRPIVCSTAAQLIERLVTTAYPE